MHKNEIENIPNLFIVGAAKAGTTSLYHYLNEHKDIYMCPIKEPNFFGKDIDWNKFDENYKRKTKLDFEDYLNKSILEEKHIVFVPKLDFYLKLFKNKPTNVKYIGEASTTYLYSKEAADEIYNFNKHAKIIIILREPVDRIISHYFMDLGGSSQKEENPFKAIKKDYETTNKGWGVSHLYIELSLYYEQVKRYLQVFPREQILILNYSTLKNDKDEFLKTVFSFLELKLTEDVLSSSQKTFNQTLLPKNILVRRLLSLKKIVPKSLVKFAKSKSSFLFKTKNDFDITDETKSYLRDETQKDWEATKEQYLKN